jgi:hypothetical protein
MIRDSEDQPQLNRVAKRALINSDEQLYLSFTSRMFDSNAKRRMAELAAAAKVG